MLLKHSTVCIRRLLAFSLNLFLGKEGNPNPYILNVDGSAQTNLRMTEFCGLIRDFDGQFICCFHGNIGYSNILHAEILALMHGIQICWYEDLTHIICYIDSMHTIHLV